MFYPNTPTLRKIAALITALLLTALFAASCRRGAASDELVMMLEKTVTTFDPRKSADSADERMRQLIFSSLTRKDAKFEPVGDLAESFTASPDYLTYTFKLRSGVKFHDGRPLTSADVKYTFDTLMSQGFQSPKSADFVRDVAAVETPDAQTVVFRCKNPYPGLPNSVVAVGIIAEGSGDSQARQPVGTGPFKFTSYAPDQEVVLAANPDYFGGAPGVQTLRVKIIPDNTTRESELRKGSVDLAINADFEPVTVESLKKVEGLKVIQNDGTNLAHLGLNVTDPILKDARVRQALAYAIDREAIIRDLLLGQGKPANSVLPTSHWAYEAGAAAYNYDPERAKKLLDEAGRKADGENPRFKLTLKTSTISSTRKVAEMMQEQLRRVGVDLDVQSLENQKLTQDITDGNYQMYIRIMVGANQSTDVFRFAYHSKSVPPNGQNRMRYSNTQVDKLLDESLTAPRERQQAIFSEVQKILSNDLPQIYLWYPAAIAVHRLRVTNLNLDQTGDWSAVKDVKLAAQ
jgi:peptide/nickel transport system substrate-binding protein